MGFAIGFAAGYWAALKSSDERRAQVEEMVGKVRDDPRVSHVAEVVTRDVRRVGDAVEARMTAVGDRAADKVADVIEPNGTTTPSSGARA
ncbi:MAG TPA: hypothetical protein VFI47_08290 [Acidimicrobiales bacterium]|nr:hypothetical protein [Acidimicrobiales bacterium]